MVTLTGVVVLALTGVEVAVAVAVTVAVADAEIPEAAVDRVDVEGTAVDVVMMEAVAEQAMIHAATLLQMIVVTKLEATIAANQDPTRVAALRRLDVGRPQQAAVVIRLLLVGVVLRLPFLLLGVVLFLLLLVGVALPLVLVVDPL